MKNTIVLIITGIMFCFTGCVTSYNIQTFSNDVQTLPSRIEKSEIRQSDGSVRTVTKRVSEGLFTAQDYESAMVLAKEAGYTKVISIETYTNHYYALIWFIGEKRVTIRCVKEEDTEKAVSPVFSDMEE